MTVRKGEPWGRFAPLPDEARIAHSDAEARRIVQEARSAGSALPPVGLLGGDLCRTLGGLGDLDRLHSDAAVMVQIDLGRVEADGGPWWFLAHCVARRAAWWGESAVVMNAQWCGPFDLGPRSHPGDGLLELTQGNLPIGDRLEARKRARSGTHLPHPALRTARKGHHEVHLARSRPLLLDGERVGRVKDFTVHVEADVLTVVV